MIVARFKTAVDGIAREARLLQEGRPSLLLWQADENALVVPKAVARRPGFKNAASLAAANGWPVTTRFSGGGIVPQGPHTLNLAMIVPCPAGFTTDDGFRAICGAIAEALTRFEVASTFGARDNVFCDGAWNVLVEGRKLAGTAQRWRATPNGRIALIHAAILTHPPEPALWPVLRGLHEVALPTHPLPQVDAHVAMDQIMPGEMKFSSFPGALVRAAEDRLTALAQQKKEAA